MHFLQRYKQTQILANSIAGQLLSRRLFLKSAAVGGGLVIGCGALPALGSAPTAGREPANGELVFNAFLKITPDNRVTVVVKHLDMGQGVSTGLTTLVAEELDANWEQMTWEHAPADASRYNNLFFGAVQGTGGSTAIANSWEQMRMAGAAGRTMLVAAAAQLWQVPAEEVQVSRGLVTQGNHKASFGELAARAAQLPVPDKPHLKDPKDFVLIGTQLPRQDSIEKTDGSAVYTQDIQLPDMLTAVVLYPPKLGGKLKSVDSKKARSVRGVVDVVEIPRGVAVVADGFWPANKARKLLEVEWDLSACETRSSDELFQTFSDTARKAGHPMTSRGDATRALNEAERVIEAEFRLPYLAHAAIEPMNCVVQVKDDACELWFGSQTPTFDQQEVAALTGMKPDQVRINTVYAGGSFGRRACPGDYVVDAAAIAKQLPGRPVKMVWTREDDMRNGKFRPMAVHRIRGAVSPEGKLIAWEHHAVAQPLLRGTPFEHFVQGPVEGTLVEGIQDTPYDIPNLLVQGTEMQAGISTLWWRSVGHSGNAFVMEAFVDQLAAAADKDPVAFRRQLLTDQPRGLGVLNLAADKAGWGSPLPKGRGRGVAVHRSFGSWCAQVAEVSVADDGSFAVDRVVCAFDCGVAVNPDVIRAQMEGSIGLGLSAALGEAVTVDKGKVVEGNYNNYQVMRLPKMPKVEVHIVPSAEPPSGAGEPGLPPIAGAVANALAAVTGKRITQLPIGAKV